MRDLQIMAGAEKVWRGATCVGATRAWSHLALATFGAG